MLLTRDELHELTGKARSDAQRRVLESMGIPYKARPDGSPAVLRQVVQILMGAPAATIRPREPEVQP